MGFQFPKFYANNSSYFFAGDTYPVLDDRTLKFLRAAYYLGKTGVDNRYTDNRVNIWIKNELVAMSTGSAGPSTIACCKQVKEDEYVVTSSLDKVEKYYEHVLGAFFYTHLSRCPSDYETLINFSHPPEINLSRDISTLSTDELINIVEEVVSVVWGRKEGDKWVTSVELYKDPPKKLGAVLETYGLVPIIPEDKNAEDQEKGDISG